MPFDCFHNFTDSNSVFRLLDKEVIDKIQRLKICKEYEKGDYIFKEAADPKGVYFIAKGKVKLSQLGVDGKYQILHLAKDGDVMGYRASLSGDLFSCSAIAMEKCHICFIPKDIFNDLVATQPKLAFNVIQLFSKELKKIESNLTKLTQRPVKDRVAQVLIALKNKYGFEEDGKTINVLIKRQEIANMAGSTRETITRVLYYFQEVGYIHLEGKQIQILNEKELFDLANLD